MDPQTPVEQINIQNNLPPQNVNIPNPSPQPQETSITKLLVSLLVLILICVGAYFYYVSTKDAQIDQPEIMTNPPVALNYLESVNKTKLPQVNNTESAGSDALPDDMNVFLPTDNSAQISTLTLGDQSNGYQVIFKHGDVVYGTYKYFRSLILSKYVLVEGRYNDAAAILIVEDADYTLNFNFQLDENKRSTNVTIQVYEKS